jgi:integrase
MLVAIFCGVRGSELRGLRWQDVDLQSRKISVAERADASHRIGKLTSKAAYRSIDMPPNPAGIANQAITGAGSAADGRR